MPKNRISSYLPVAETSAAGTNSTHFASTPAFLTASTPQVSSQGVDVYRLAQELARQQIAARREVIVNRIRRYLSN